METNTAQKGIDIILLYRILKKSTEEAAWKLAFQTEHENGMSRDVEGTATKDGTVQSLGAVEYDFSATSIVAVGDPHYYELKQAFIDGEVIEFWEINKAELAPETDSENAGKFFGTYYQGYLSDFSRSAATEDASELEMSLAVNGIGQDGWCTLTDEQAEIVQYVFKDTVKEEEEPVEPEDISVTGVAEGASPLAITGLEPESVVADGDYVVKAVENDIESDPVDIAGFTVASE